MFAFKNRHHPTAEELEAAQKETERLVRNAESALYELQTAANRALRDAEQGRGDFSESEEYQVANVSYFSALNAGLKVAKPSFAAVINAINVR